MGSKRFLVVDTETGGLDPVRNCLLTIGAVVWDNGKILAEREFFVLEERFDITPSSLLVHQVDLRDLAKRGQSPKKAVAEFLKFARRYFPKKDRIALAGHNVGFDAGFLKRLFTQAGLDYDTHVSHRLLDTASILGYLNLAGKLPLTSRGLSEAIKYFKLKVDPSKRHTALEDARVTAALLTRLVRLA